MIDANPKSKIQNPKSEESAPIRLPVFEGPMELLLHLIRQHKLDIYDIPIAQVTKQYVEYLHYMEALNVDLAGEFLVMAATLMEIKSRMLLPKPPPPEGEEEGVDPRQELVDRLLEYQKFQEAAGLLRELEEERRRCFPRGGLIDFEPGPSIAIEPESAAVSLLLALRRLLDEADKREDVPPTLRRDRMTLRLKIREVWAALQEAPDGLVFEALFRHGGDREEIIATFLALLELLRGGRVRVVQREALGTILVRPVEGE
ncbi:MAG: segregation/condensation protein A [Armatimonadetes bacterium]|nr:segregation/condensation protein A [Armatimonadota bacterium]